MAVLALPRLDSRLVWTRHAVIVNNHCRSIATLAVASLNHCVLFIACHAYKSSVKHNYLCHACVYLVVMSQQIDYDSVSFVISSSYRETVVEALSEQSQTPSEINQRNGEPGIAHVSRALNELREKKLVELLVSEDTKKGRIYGLTEDGEAVAEEVKSRE